VLDRPNVPRVNSVNFSLSVGTRIPRNSVRFVAVPDTLISINPAWRGHSFFVVRDEIVIVEPREETIVAVVPVGSSGAALEGRPSGGRFATGGGTGGEIHLSREEIIEVQQILVQQGFDVEVDGVFGTRTRQALVSFQQKQGLQATGRIDSRTMTALRSGSTTTGQGGGNMQQQPSQQQPQTSGQGGAPKQQPQTSGQGGASKQQPQTSGQGGASQQQPQTSGQGGTPKQQPANPSGRGASGNQMAPSQHNAPSGNAPADGRQQQR